MRILHSYNYKHRSLLILVPLMLLAICTWSLNEVVTPFLTAPMRYDLLLIARIFFLGLFAVAVAFVVPTFDRFLQILVVIVSYVLMIALIKNNMPELLKNPILCVVAAVSSLLALLPYQIRNDYYRQRRSLIFPLILSLSLPFVTLIGAYVVLRQTDTYILYTFDETFGRSFLSVMYVPIYIALQTLGFHDFVGDLISLRYQNNMVTAFVNAIIVTNLFSVPAIIFARSLFTKRHVRLFLTLLMVIAIMTNSIGSCVSLILLLLLIFYPGSFSLLLVSSMTCFSISYFLQIAPITTVSNLYLPDVSLDHNRFFLFYIPVAILELMAILIPLMLVLSAMLVNKEKILDRRRKLRSINVGYTVDPTSSPEIYLISMLRALGGISNISDVVEDSSWLYIQVVDVDKVSLSTLNSFSQEKLLLDRINKIYLLNIGEQSHFLCERLLRLIENQFGEEEYEVPLSTPFDIKKMSKVQALKA